MSKKILIISGPTATGKTSLAVRIAKEYNGELISADSRQIYQGMDIGTGKDHPKDIQVHLTDLITPNQSFSVAEFQKLALVKINQIQSRGKLPIIVGGTGQYIDSLINPHTETFSVRPFLLLRFFLNRLPVFYLQKICQVLDKKSYLNLNNSDLHNPHRLIRKIEISIFNHKKTIFPLSSKGELKGDFNYLHLSLTAPNSYLYSQIDQRIEKRLKLGLLDEINNLLRTYSWHHPGLNTLAYKELRPYFENRMSLETCIQKWRYDEHAYARRQKTWFKKYSLIHFFDITQTKFPDNLINLINKWYNEL